MLEKIYLGDSGIKVSPAVYGFYRWDEINDSRQQTMETIVHLCLELGINTFDHSDVYGAGECEVLFGKLFESGSIKREEVVIFTKCGVIPAGDGRRHRYVDTSGSRITASIEESLKKLKTDYADVFLLDHLDPLSDLEETANAIIRLRSSGKIKSFGVANFTVFQHQLLASYLPFPIITNHIELSLLNTTALDNGQLDFLRQQYTRPLASAPLAAGRIENGIDPLAYQVRSVLKDVAARYGRHIESIAVAWLVKLGALPLIGTTSEARIRNIAEAFSIDLSREDWYELYAASKI
jgi:predicted oxidoreductase